VSRSRRSLNLMEVLELILAERRTIRGRREITYRKQLRNYNIMLLQLTNGLSVSEAVECYYRFLETGERRHLVHMAQSKGRFKLCIVPHFITELDRELTKDLVIPPRKMQSRLSSILARRRYGFNTDDLKRAFYNYLVKGEADHVTISRIVDLKAFDKIVEFMHEIIRRRFPAEVEVEVV